MTEKEVEYVMDYKYFPNCIECSEHYLDSELRHSFHKTGCTRGRDVEWSIISKRLDERLEAFNKRYGKNGCNMECEVSGCTNKAIGMMHVFYHNTKTTAEKWAVCMDHAYHEDSAGRETQFKGF